MNALAKRVAELVKVMGRVVERADVEAVHDLRVGVRRVAAGIRRCPDEVRHPRRFRREVKAIRERAAVVRDRDVTRQLLRRYGLPAADPAFVYLQGQRDLAASQLRGFVAKLLRRERPERWQRWLAGGGARGRDSGTATSLSEDVERFFEAGERAAGSSDLALVHEFRIAVKLIRYTLELLDPPGAASRLKRLRQVQQQIGEMNDARVAEEFLSGLPKRSAGARRLPRRLRTEASAKLALFQRTWRRHFRARVRAEWLVWALESEQ